MINGKILAETAEKVVNDRITRYCEKVLSTTAVLEASKGERTCSVPIPYMLNSDEIINRVIAKFRDDYYVECSVSEHKTYFYLKWQKKQGTSVPCFFCVLKFKISFTC